jgi:hypothetical protein
VNLCPHQPLPALPDALWDSVTRKIFTLPAETLLFSCHAHRARSVTNVLEQRRWHPWFCGAGRDEFLSRIATASIDTDNHTDTAANSRRPLFASTNE